MALTTYSELVTAITEYAMRQGDAEFIARCPDFITLAEKRILRNLRTSDMETSATITLTSGSGTLPTDYLAFRRVVANSSPRVVLELLSPDDAFDRYPTDTAGIAEHFTIIGTTIKTFPTSSATLALQYYAKPAALTSGAPTNWLLTKNPDLYLYGSLMEGAVYMKDDQELARWGALFERAMKDVHEADVMGRYSRFSQRVRGPTP